MPLPVIVPEKAPLLGLKSEEFDALVTRQCGWPAFRAQQVRDWVYGKLVDRPENMSNLSKADRALLAEKVEFASGEVTKHQAAATARKNY